jgi:serine/threonine protein kinase
MDAHPSHWSDALLARDNLGEFLSLGAFGDWSVLEELGEGGAGLTLLAEDRSNPGVRLAIKLIRTIGGLAQSELERFKAECEILETLDSDGIVRVHESGVTAGVPWIAMDFIDGPTLWDQIVGDGGQKVDLVKLVTGLTQALVDAHEAKISHNDLKPTNIMFDSVKKRYVVIDYGLGRFQKIGGVRHSMFMGTPFYAPPEQHGSRTYVTSDVYSAGVCIIEALTGTNPWRDRANSERAAAGIAGAISESQRVSAEDQQLEMVPAEWRAILRGMVDRDARARFTAIQARDEWQKALGVHRTLEPVGPTSQSSVATAKGFASGKIEYQSWSEIEKSISDRIAQVGLDSFTLDVNTSAKMVVNFRVRRDESGAFELVCPTTARNGKMAKLGWAFNPVSEQFSRRFEPDPSPHEVATRVSAALQIGFEVRLRDVGILI